MIEKQPELTPEQEKIQTSRKANDTLAKVKNMLNEWQKEGPNGGPMEIIQEEAIKEDKLIDAESFESQKHVN